MSLITEMNCFAPILNSLNMDPINKMLIDISKLNESEYLIEANLAGFSKENVSIEYKDNILTITAKKEIKKESKYLLNERSGELKRNIYFEELDENSIKAKLENGVLKVTLRKKEKVAKNIFIE